MTLPGRLLRAARFNQLAGGVLRRRSDPGACPYDDPAFFASYQQMRQIGTGLNEDLEQPAPTRMLPDVAGRDALDLGCGGGAFVRWLASCGARHVLGIDPSERMLVLAAHSDLDPSDGDTIGTPQPYRSRFAVARLAGTSGSSEQRELLARR